jgi:hypothetical protein
MQDKTAEDEHRGIKDEKTEEPGQRKTKDSKCSIF